MSKITTSDRLRGYLREHQATVGSFEPWAHFEQLADAALTARSQEGEIAPKDVRRLLKQESTGAKHRARVRRRLSRLLAAGNQLGVWRSPLPSEQVLKPRPSVAPMSADVYQRQQGARSVERYFRKYTLKPRLDSRSALLGAAMFLASRLGADEPVIYGILTNMRRSHLDAETGWLTTPSQPSVESSGRYRIQLPNPLKKLLCWQHRSLPRRIGVWSFSGVFAEPSNNNVDVLPDAEDVASNIKDSYSHLIRSYKAEVGTPEFPLPKTFKQFVAAARQNALSIGMPPNLVTLMSGYPLPVSPPHLALLDHEPTRAVVQMVQKDYLDIGSPLAPVVIGGSASDTASLMKATDWVGFVQSELKAYLHRLEQHCTRIGYLKKGRERAVYEVLEDFDRRAIVGVATVNMLRVVLQYGAF